MKNFQYIVNINGTTMAGFDDYQTAVEYLGHRHGSVIYQEMSPDGELTTEVMMQQ